MTHILGRDATRICRGCGCDDLHACAGGCSWTLFDLPQEGVPPTGVCSSCAEHLAWRWDLLAIIGTGAPGDPAYEGLEQT